MRTIGATGTSTDFGSGHFGESVVVPAQ